MKNIGRKRMLYRLSALAVAASLLVTACAPTAQAPAPAPAGTTTSGSSAPAPAEQRDENQVIRVGVTGLIGNPTPQSSSSNLFMFWPMYDSLTQFGANYEVKPSIAEKWDLSADGKTWTFTIRKDMKWPNGDPLTANDVAFTMNTINDKSWPQKAFFANVTGAKATSDTTVDFTTKQQDMSVPNGGPYMWVVPQKYYESIGFDAFVQTPMGSGPYEMTSFKAADSISFKKRTVDHAFRKPVATEISFKVIPDNGQIVAGLRTGEIDIAAQVNFSGDQVDQLKAAGLNVYSAISSVSSFPFVQGTYDRTNSPLKDIRVRQALNYAVDKEAIAKTIYKGYSKPTGQVAVPGSLYWDDSVQPYPYDVKKAKDLLAAAGYPNGFKLPLGMDYTAGMTLPDIIVAMKGYFNDVGVDVPMINNELGVFVDKAYGRNNTVKGDMWSGGTGDGNGFFVQNRTFTGCGRPVGGSPDALLYCNPEWDRLLDAAFAERDPVKRGDLMRQANKVFRDDVPVIFFLNNSGFIINTQKTKGIEIAMPLAYNFDSAYKIK
jgi:peptide/nickel transport system substrate-binding protein